MWEDITNIEYRYGRASMIVISLNNGKTFIIMSIFGNKVKFKQSLYKSIPKSFHDIIINLILSVGSFKSRFLKRMKIYNFLSNSNFIDDLEFLKIDSEDKEYIKTIYKDNLSELRLLIKKHYGINFEI